MKPKTRKIPRDEYMALVEQVSYCGWITPPRYFDTGFTMVTGDFLVTQNMMEARWIYVAGHYDKRLFQVDAIDDAILLLPQ